jgi:hypothetical protein
VVKVYLLDDKEVVDETESYDSDPLLFAEHGTDAETEAEGETKSTGKTCDKKHITRKVSHVSQLLSIL